MEYFELKMSFLICSTLTCPEDLVSEIKGCKSKYSDKIVTEVVPFKAFYPAEDYHQEYILHNPQNPYVQNVSLPDFLEFKKAFKGNFKL